MLYIASPVLLIMHSQHIRCHSSNDHQSSPAEFFDGRDINNTVVKVLNELRHVPRKKHLVHVNAVACQWTSWRRCVCPHKL